MKTEVDMFLLSIDHLLSDIKGPRYLHKKGGLFCWSPGMYFIFDIIINLFDFVRLMQLLHEFGACLSDASL